MQNPDNVLQKRYRIDHLYELGAVETIYWGWDTVTESTVTISETRAQPNLIYEDLQRLKEQFVHQTHKLCSLQHPNLIAPIDCFISDRKLIDTDQGLTDSEHQPHSYVITPAVEYDSMMTRINIQGALPEEDVLRWADQILQALDYCHKQGIFHGDIRPHNIYIDSEGNAVLTQFEVPSLWPPSDPRKWTAKRVLGTPDYASPERWSMRIGQIDEKSDIYSLGATLFHALTGHLPLSAEERTANPYSFQNLQISNSNVSQHTKNVIYKALAVPKDKRYPNATAMSAALRTPSLRSIKESKLATPAFFPVSRPKPKFYTKIAGMIISTIVMLAAAITGLWLNTVVPPIRFRSTPATVLLSSTPAIALLPQPTDTVAPTPTNLHTMTPEPVPTEEPTIPTIIRTTVISDTFDSNVNHWPLSDHQDEWGSITREVIDGGYIWNIGAEQDVGRWCLPDSNSFAENYHLSVDIKRHTGPANTAYGLIIRHSEGSYYVFNVRDDGYYRFSLWQGFEWVTIIDWTQTLTIKPGEFNHLEVRAKDSEFEFYINNIYIGDAVDDEISAGDNGLSVIVLANPDIATVEFDNFSLESENSR